MTGGWQVRSRWSNAQSIGAVTSNSGQTGVPSAAANTAGAWTQIIAATTVTSQAVLLQFIKASGTPVTYAVSIGVGAAGSEVNVCPNLLLSGTGSNEVDYLIPLTIPAGSRVALQCASSGAYVSAYCNAILFADGAFSAVGSTIIDTYGFTSGTTCGTALDPGGTANTKGAYSQLTAATTGNLSGFALALDCQARTASGSNFNNYLIDIAVGPAGSECGILPNLFTYCSGSTDLSVLSMPFISLPIPAGTRIAARCQSVYATAGDRTIGLTLYGARQ